MFADFWSMDRVLKRRESAKRELRRYANALEDAGLHAEADRVLQVRRSLFGSEIKVSPAKERLN